MRTVNYSKHIWEGWTVRDFINDIEYSVDITINDYKSRGIVITKDIISRITSDQQPYYKKIIPDVVNYFCNKYNVINQIFIIMNVYCFDDVERSYAAGLMFVAANSEEEAIKIADEAGEIYDWVDLILNVILFLNLQQM